jgi:hypothetical protein
MEQQLLSIEYLREVMNRCNQATPGPWVSYVEGRDQLSGSSFIMRGEGDQRVEDLELRGPTNVADQDFIAHARQDVVILLKEVDTLRAMLGLEGISI